MTGSVLFHVQYLLGIGHLQRSLQIAEALLREGVAVTLVSGGPPTSLPRDPAIRFIQLPPIRAMDAEFQLVDGAGRPVGDELREERRTALLEAFAATRPDAVVIEGYPFARRAFRFELEPLIAAARATAPRPRLLCSLRDIVVTRDDPARHRAIVEQVRRDFDAVLVHGDPAFIPLDASFPAAPEIADRLIYTGYVAPDRPIGAAERADDEVLVSAGGGAAGKALLTAALAARQAGCLAGFAWRLIAGTHLPEAEFARLRQAAPDRVIVERFRDDFPELLRRCRVSVSQAGYNTVLDILAAGARAVLVPFAAARETEQLRRAERLVALGAAELVPESELTPARLTAAIERTAGRTPPAVPLATAGAATSARMIATMILSGRRGHSVIFWEPQPRYDGAMSDSLRCDAATADWPDLAAELDRWGEAGCVAALWWRDDDAVAATARLDALLRLAAGVPLALAVIPALARPELAARLADSGPVAVLQHGWQHADRAGDGKKSEYPDGRPAAVVGAEIGAGRARLRSMFGERALHVFVPPWNRIGDSVAARLPAAGIAGLSVMASHRARPRPAGLAAVDVHVDPVYWRGDRGFVGTGRALGQLVGWLRARRLAADHARPIGLLTHHLVMDRATAAFIEQLLAATRRHGAARWAAIGEFLP